MIKRKIKVDKKFAGNDSRDYMYSNGVGYNITENYYPVTSAISIFDTKSKKDLRELLVVNDRPMGGSSLRPGQVELMHNRRMYTHDGLGVDEDYMEIDNQTNRGIQVKITYYVQLI